jgi:hypothetical protein
MATWKKVITEQDKLSELSNVGSTVASPSQNETLIFDGTNWQAAPEGTEYNFSITSFGSSGFVENGTQLQGTENTDRVTNISFTANYANLTGNPDSNPSVAVSGDVGTGQTTTYDMGADGDSGASDFDVEFPVADWSSNGRQSTKFELTATEGGVTDTSSFYLYYKNHRYWGVQASQTLTSAEVLTMGSASGGGYNFAGTDYELSLQSGGSSLDGTGYIHYVYPARITGTPTFWISGLEVGFWLVDDDLEVTNSAGYMEEFKHYRSPQSYTSASNTFQVT